LGDDVFQTAVRHRLENVLTVELAIHQHLVDVHELLGGIQ